MNIKLTLGIFLPLALILFLVILSTANIGFSLEKQDITSVQFSSLFVDKNSPKNNIPIQTITITNDFFLSKRYELPKLIVCLNDKGGIKEIQNIQVKYNEGSYARGSNAPIFDEIFFDYNYNSKQSIELPAESKKQVKILVEPKYLYNYDTEIDSYKEYDELLLIESKDTSIYSYNSCRNLESKEMDSATHILIAK
ncbi:MAG: hypothetical protein QF864_09855 [SAR202 cluster bacterium]|jgi:hypothetical protein|nr:hypothetical protein [SAR202 cluster bacterium]